MSPSKPAKRRRLSATAPAHAAPSPSPPYPFEKPALSSSTARGKHAFKWLLNGLSVPDFFSTYFEKKPCIQHTTPSKYTALLSAASIRALLLDAQKLHYGTDLDVTSYTPTAGRTTHNKAHGTTAGAEAWRLFTGASACSLRLLRPQQHSDALYRLCASLEEFLGCVVGANAYLTPPNSQGFAPHFDDIDAFVCQIHGTKRWRVYKPRSDHLDDLPRNSSIDFARADVDKADLLYDQVLHPGDMLYLPRGTIHEARCPGGKERQHEGDDAVLEGASLHVTISAFQRWTWADLLLESFELAVRSAAAEDRALRRTLPLRFTDFTGVSKGESRKEQREWFQGMVRTMVRRVGKAYPTDAAGDVLAARFMRERLPPPPSLSKPYGASSRKNSTKQAGLRSIVRAVSAGVARVVMDTSSAGDGLPRLLHCINNSRVAGETPVEEAEVPCLPAEAFAVDFVLEKYPKSVVVNDLPLEQEEDRVELARGLIDMRILEVLR